MDLDLDKLADIAEEANTGHPWAWTGLGDHGYPQRISAVGVPYLIAETYDGVDHPSTTAEHIAAFDPPTALALIELARKAVGLELWGSDCDECGNTTPGSMVCSDCDRSASTRPIWIASP